MSWGNIHVDLNSPREENKNERKTRFDHCCPGGNDTCMGTTTPANSARTIHAGAFCLRGDRNFDSEKIQKIAALLHFGAYRFSRLARRRGQVIQDSPFVLK